MIENVVRNVLPHKSLIKTVYRQDGRQLNCQVEVNLMINRDLFLAAL